MYAMNASISSIRAEMERNVGRRIAFKSNRGRKKCFASEGVLEDVYENVFTILVNDVDVPQRHCYTYSDILTRNVEFMVLQKE